MVPCNFRKHCKQNKRKKLTSRGSSISCVENNFSQYNFSRFLIIKVNMHIFTQSENVIAVNSNIQPCIKNFETIIVTMSCVTFKFSLCNQHSHVEDYLVYLCSIQTQILCRHGSSSLKWRKARNPSTPMSDQDTISSHKNNTISSRQVMRI